MANNHWEILNQDYSSRFQDYRKPYWEENKYKPTDMFWHVLAARLAFVVLFQVGVVTIIIWV